MLRFLINRRGDNFCDSTRWDPTVAFVNDSWVYGTGFSSTQRLNRWSYQAGSTDLTYDALQGWWAGTESGFPILAPGWSHPGLSNDAVLRWSAPYAGTARITGTATDGDISCGDGVDVKIVKGNVTLWGPFTVVGSTTAAHDVAIEVAPGDDRLRDQRSRPPHLRFHILESEDRIRRRVAGVVGIQQHAGVEPLALRVLTRALEHDL